MRARFQLVAALLSIALLSWLSHEMGAAASDHITFFYPDSRNIANRLYRWLHVRSAYGKEYGRDSLDPYLWSETKHLLTDAPHAQAISLLDEFLRSRADRQISDPLKRAILQRDLWAVFDWADTPDAEYQLARSELMARLAPAVRRLALTPEEIAALPDTYTRALQTREFPTAYDPSEPNRPFLPPDLFDPQGPWVCLGAPGNELAAPLHDSSFVARSAFLVFAHLPAGRDATLAYFKQLAEMSMPLFVKMQPTGFPQAMNVWNPQVPQFPAGTEFALVRRMLLPAHDGNLQLTSITESIQIRRYTGVPNVDPGEYRDVSLAQRFQAPSEIELSRSSLFSGHSGLRGVISSDDPLLILPAMAEGFDALEDPRMRPLTHISPFVQCTGCHLGPGIQSMMSFSARGAPGDGPVLSPRLAETTPQREFEKVIAAAQRQEKWKDLLRLWSAEIAH